MKNGEMNEMEEMKDFKEIVKDLQAEKKVYRKDWGKVCCGNGPRPPKYIHIKNGEICDDIGCRNALDMQDFLGKDWLIWEGEETCQFNIILSGCGRNQEEAWNNAVEAFTEDPGIMPEEDEIKWLKKVEH